jgi:hypothetical protein
MTTKDKYQSNKVKVSHPPNPTYFLYDGVERFRDEHQGKFKLVMEINLCR